MAAFTCGRTSLTGCLFNSLRQAAFPIKQIQAPTCTAIRFYQGSRRNTRKRERVRKYKLRQKEPSKVFDEVAFMREHFESEVSAFSKRLQIEFKNEEILQAAMTHPSFLDTDHCDDSDVVIGSNTKLSVLGVQLASHWIVEVLYFKYPQLPPFAIRQLHEYLMSRKVIVKLAEDLALPELVRLQYDLKILDTEKHLGYTREDVMTDTFFALIAAIYTDQGPFPARSFVHDFILQQLNSQELPHLFNYHNPKKLLSDMLISQGRPQPTSRVMHESGKLTPIPVYVVGIFSGETLLAEGSGWKQRYAVKDAYNEALMKEFEKDTRQKPSLPSDREEEQLIQTLHKLEMNSRLL